jgi:Ca-activated chloride channel homolog
MRRRAPSRLALLLVTLLVTSAAVFGGLERGNRLYRAGQYAEAVEAYRAALGTRADGPVLRYNLGTALLHLGNYAEAEEYLRSALDRVEPQQRGLVHYNLGQRFLEEARLSPDPAASAALYDAAVEAYREALRLQPRDADAKWNYELALRERDEQQTGGGGDDEDDRDQDPQEGGEGTGAGSPGRSDRDPAAGPGDHAPMTQEQAERLLSAIEQDERELLRDRLRQGPQERPPARDW